MRVKELLELANGRVIAESAYDGRILFDSSRNRKEHIEKYLDHKVYDMCGDVVAERGKYDYYHRIRPVLRITISSVPIVVEEENE